MLENKNAIIYGAGGSIGGAVARAFAHEGAKVFLAGRTLAKLDKVAHFRTHVFDDPENWKGEGSGPGMTREEFEATVKGKTLLRRLPTLADVANTATFIASDRAGAMTGTVVTVTCGNDGN